MASSKQERENADKACKIITDFLETKAEEPIIKDHAFIVLALSKNGFAHACDDRIDAEMQIQIFNHMLKSLTN